jgi:pimeloyl-ACP methyl ester carboxylesterase
MADPVLRSIMAPDVGDDVVAAAVASMARISADGLRAAVEFLPTHDVRARLGEIAAPTLVLVGEHDEETPLSYAEALAAGIPGATLQIIPGAGHISNLEAPDAVTAALRAHLDAAEGAR